MIYFCAVHVTSLSALLNSNKMTRNRPLVNLSLPYYSQVKPSDAFLQLHDDLKPFFQPEESDSAINLLSAPVVCHIQSCKENGTFSSALADTDVINHSKVIVDGALILIVHFS